MTDNTKMVFVSIVGRPNVGKSSIMNYLVGEKVSIVTPKPQTTRTRITGVLTQNNVQFVFYDTPGVHRPRTQLGQRMSKMAHGAVGDGDITMVVFDPFSDIDEQEEKFIKSIIEHKVFAIAVINKIDTAKKVQLEERQKQLENTKGFRHILLTSAKTGAGCAELLAFLSERAQPSPFFFDADYYTDQPEKQIVAEIIREKLLIFMQEEIPHGTAVEIELFKERPDKNMVDISAVLVCEKKSHKGMIIGKGGQMLKKIGSSARVSIEDFLGIKVNLQCWVKVREDWRDNERILNSFGFEK